MTELESLRERNEQLQRQLVDANQAIDAFARGEVDAVALGSPTPILLAAAQEKLRRGEALLRAIFDGSLDAILLADDHGKYVDANPAACELFGLSRDQLVGRPVGNCAVGRMIQGDRVLDYREVANVSPGLHLSTLRDITEQVAVEDALRAGRDRLEEAQAVAHVGSWISGAGLSDEILWSSECYRIFGIEGGSPVTVASFLENVHPDDRDLVQRASRDAWEHDAPYDLAHRITRPDGSVRWVQERAIVERDSAERPTRMVGTVQDVTERYLAVEALKQGEERLRVLHDVGEVMRTAVDPMEAIPDALRILGQHLRVSRCVYAMVDIDGVHCNVSRDYIDGCASMAGRQRLADLGTSVVTDSAPVVVRDLGAKAFVSCLLIGHVTLRAVMAVHQTKAHDWTPGEISIVQEVASRCWAAVEKSGADKKLRENEALLRIAGRAARLGGWSMSFPEGVIKWSDEVCAIHEVPSGTAPDMDRAVAFYAPEYRDSIRNSVEACLRDGTPFDVELQIVTAKDRRVWVRAIGNAERGLNGAITALRGAFQDIDEHRNLREQFRQAQKMEAVGRLAGGVAHDFNNLLTVILSCAQLALEDLRPGDPLLADLEEIQKAAHRATGLIRQLLAFSRRQVLEPRVIDLDAIILAMKPMLARLLGADIHLTMLSAHRIGSVIADPQQVEQVVMNLAVNARDAMPGGGNLTIETTNVRVDAAHPEDVPPGPFVMLAVTDTGMGMSEAVRARIFEPFFTTKELGKGTGLGLATVFGIVQQSGGYVRVYSEPEHGTTFKIYLPRTDRVATPLISRALPVVLKGSETILLVEDEDQVRAVSCSILRKHGYNVLETSNGGEAFLVSKDFPARIDLLLTDVVMPRLSGRKVAEQLALQRPEMKVLFASGYTDDTIIQHGVLDSGVCFLQKPFTPHTLLRKVREVLDGGS